MFASPDPNHYVPASPGVQRKTMVHGAATLLTEFRMQQGSQMPSHSHPYEQTGYLVAGRIRLTIGDESFEAGPGASWCIPSGVAHAAEVKEDSVAIEVFSPARTDYIGR